MGIVRTCCSSATAATVVSTPIACNRRLPRCLRALGTVRAAANRYRGHKGHPGVPIGKHGPCFCCCVMQRPEANQSLLLQVVGAAIRRRSNLRWPGERQGERQGPGQRQGQGESLVAAAFSVCSVCNREVSSIVKGSEVK